jgi:anti-sigma regulatory factor (Ser/Thr protein kinase)
MRIAQAIQRSLLPESLPAPPGWQIGAHYQPAQVVGGDLYDVIPLPNDLLGIVLGDVSDKSVPAALMMAATRTLLHATAQRVVLPDQVLARVNDALCTQIPPGVFVTCFFAILDPGTGRLRFANAGQCAPVHCAQAGPTELRARGWPLGMMPGASYDEAEIVIAPGESILCFSDGLIESHDAEGAMFGASSVLSAIASAPHDSIPLIETILSEHNRFVGPIWRQEDDLTLFSITRLPPTPNDSNFREGAPKSLGDFQVPSQEGTERLAAERVVDLTREVDLTNQQRERLKTAVAETVMNAIEHGNLHRPDLMVGVSVLYDDMKLIVRVSDHGRNSAIPIPVMPDLEAKLSGHQSPRGWGLFLIENMVDEMRVLADGAGHTVELVIHLAQPNDHTATVTAP